MNGVGNTEIRKYTSVRKNFSSPSPLLHSESLRFSASISSISSGIRLAVLAAVLVAVVVVELR